MKYSGVYALLLVLHLLTVAFLVGPTAIASVTSARHARAGRADALRDAARTTRLYGLATLATVLLGTGLVGLGNVGDQWSYSQVWISASFVLWVVASGLTLSVVVPAQAAAADAIDAGQDASGPVISGLARRMAAAGGLATLAWSAIIVLMVVKPGA